MNDKVWMFEDESGVSFCQTDGVRDTESDVMIRIPSKDQSKFMVTPEQTVCEITFEAELFDSIAVAWIKHRGQENRLNKYSLEELLAKCGELKDTEEDTYLSELVWERFDQEEIEVQLEFNNIFDVVTENQSEAERMKAISDFLIQLRELHDELKRALPMLSDIKDSKEHQNALLVMEVMLDDYDKYIVFIDALSAAIQRYEEEHLE